MTTKTREKAQISPLLALVPLWLFWGFNFVVMKKANDFFAPSFFAAMRFSLGALILLVFAFIRKSPLPPKHLWPWIILTGAMQIAFCNVAIHICLKQLGSGLVAVLTYTLPIWVAILAKCFLNESLTLQKIAGIVISITGIGILMNVELSSNIWAILLGVSVAVIWAISSIIMKAKLMVCDMMALTAWQMTAAAVSLIGYTLVTGSFDAEWSALSIGCIAYNGVLASAIAFLLWCYVLTHMEAGKAAVSVLAVPAVGVLSGCLCYGEPLSLPMGLGMVLVIGGIVLVQRAKAPQ
ncbi:MAG: EamA family transporter [Oxalobacter sp.]|nr:EamA family transporter [Oxalobacter sp.]